MKVPSWHLPIFILDLQLEPLCSKIDIKVTTSNGNTRRYLTFVIELHSSLHGLVRVSCSLIASTRLLYNLWIQVLLWRVLRFFSRLYIQCYSAWKKNELIWNSYEKKLSKFQKMMEAQEATSSRRHESKQSPNPEANLLTWVTSESRAPTSSQNTLEWDETDEVPTNNFAFLNVSNPSESLSLENRKKVRQHVRYQVTAEVRAARKSQIIQGKRTTKPRAAVLETGESPFVNVFHPNQIAAPHLVTFVRQQAQRNYKKDRLMRSKVSNAEESQQAVEIENFNSSVATFEYHPRLLKLFEREASPARFHLSLSSAM